jgi:predicted nucleic acid-binding protein
MRYVLDASVALKWVLRENDTPLAQRLRSDYVSGTHDLLAPDIFAVEVGHSLSRSERRRVISPAEGQRHLRDVLATLPLLFPSLPLLPRAYEISSARRVSVYDCLYVALAEREGCELVTSDQRLIRSLQPHFPCILPLASLP